MAENYLSLFPGATREHPRFMALAEAVLRQAADLMPLPVAVNRAFSPGEAAGVPLDALGASLGLSRGDCPEGATATDEEFRAFLLDKLKLWCGDGTNGENTEGSE